MLGVIRYVLYVMRYTLCVIRYALYAMRYALYVIRYTLCVMHYTRCVIRYTLYVIRYALYVIRYALYVMCYTLCVIRYVFTLCVIRYTLYVMHDAWCVMLYTLYVFRYPWRVLLRPSSVILYPLHVIRVALSCARCIVCVMHYPRYPEPTLRAGRVPGWRYGWKWKGQVKVFYPNGDKAFGAESRVTQTVAKRLGPSRELPKRWRHVWGQVARLATRSRMIWKQAMFEMIGEIFVF